LEEKEGTHPQFGSAAEVVAVRGREKLGWNVAESVYATHRDWATDEGYNSHARAVEDAMRAFMDADGYAEAEDLAEDILTALNLEAGAKKTGQDPLDGHPVEGGTREVGRRVDADLKTEFARTARVEWDSKPGVALSHALQEHHDTGARNRQQRLAEKLETIRAAVNGASLTNPEDKAARISDQLGEAFRLEDFVDAAASVGVTTENYALKKYLPKVLNRTETVPHPGNPRRFIPTSAPTAPDNPNPASLPYRMMNDEQKRVGVRVAAIRKAWLNGGMARLTVSEGVDALSGGGSPRNKTVRAAMREAATSDGFRYDESEEPVLKVNRAKLNTSSRAVTIAAEERARESDDSTAGKAGEPDETSDHDTEDPAAKARAEAKAALEDYDKAEMATDGGRDRP
jgi:hypothetical protein